MGQAEGKRLTGRPRRNAQDNIQMDLKEIEWGGIHWSDLALVRHHLKAVVNTVIEYLVL
jgi:hypothetical protein